ncbi:putative coproporphyrinogen III oxidase [Actinobacillus pleuropneumoniae]|nr:putative coproporphyrinogen III oxidase [Actinobacillus pleuropneumoniae]KIE98704.1 putative coproporphyrinogen III oxidase [Actinobacillus pleuropneumoniae]
MEFDRLQAEYQIDFKQYFAEDLALLEPLAKDGLLEINENGIVVSPRGRLLIRNICLCFDVYSRQLAKRQQFSRII